uniref:Acid tail secreted protein n=1 Tax=Rhipicephalus zambeziensis TaxID=60191 RepID=A0A224Y3T8_9ACAR
MNAVVVLLFIASALFINECYSTAEGTSPINAQPMCTEQICNRSINAAGTRVTVGCPDGCLCVFNVPDTTYPANGTCYQLATRPTTTNSPSVD